MMRDPREQQSLSVFFRGGVIAAAALCAACAGAPAQPPASAQRLSGADSVRSTSVAPGVTHTWAWDARGPWAMHIVEIDAAVCAPMLQARKPGTRLSARAMTSELAAGALVTINADFFMLPGGTPVGAHVTGGVPLTGPTDRQVFAVTPVGWRSGVAQLDGHAWSGADSVRLSQVNRSPAAFSAYAGTQQGATLFTAWSDTVPADSGARRLLLRVLSGDERGGRGVIERSEAATSAVVLHGRDAALLVHGADGRWADRRAVGDTLEWFARVVMRGDTGQDAAASEAVGGFPELLRDGADVLATQTVREAFGLQRHPRTAVGWSADASTLFFVVVDGRQPPYSDGMSLPELTWLFRLLGAAHALNLDGGGSTALVIGGRLMNRPTDAEGERLVGNALSLVGCG